MIWPDVTLQDLDIHGATDLPDKTPKTFANIATKNRLAVLGDEHEMIVKKVAGVRRLPVAAHR